MAIRYTFFYILYPIGAFSEWQLLTDSLGEVKKFNVYLCYVYSLISFLYAPGFYQMYTHMISQRAKALKPKDKAKKSQ
jgi:very-long-chain (3R)-3-hydroxyacyl-CoA dehydratase